MTTNDDLVENVRVEPGISDHNLILFDINMTPRLQKKPTRTIYKYNEADSVIPSQSALKTQPSNTSSDLRKTSLLMTTGDS